MSNIIQEGDGFNIINDEEKNMMVFEFTNTDAFQAYLGGKDDHRQWDRHPVTAELKQFVQNNRKQHQVFVKMGKDYDRVR